MDIQRIKKKKYEFFFKKLLTRLRACAIITLVEGQKVLWT